MPPWDMVMLALGFAGGPGAGFVIGYWFGDHTRQKYPIWWGVGGAVLGLFFAPIPLALQTVLFGP